jgi:hypothetical protein
MSTRRTKELIRAGEYIVEVPVDLIEDDTEWSPYLSREDASKLDEVRMALEADDMATASRYGRVFKLVPIAWPEPLPGSVYNLFREAILREKQVVCMYNGFYRELCPVIIGHSHGAEKVLAYQFGGDSQKGLPRGGEWRCFDLSDVREAELRDGPWREGVGHASEQTCVKDVDLDINIHVRKLRASTR